MLDQAEERKNRHNRERGNGDAWPDGDSRVDKVEGYITATIDSDAGSGRSIV